MVIIHCDQVNCKFNKAEESLHPNKHDVTRQACTHPKPWFTYNINQIVERNCMSKHIKKTVPEVNLQMNI